MAAIRIGQRYDIFMGGLVGVNKFPSVALLEVLWRAYLRTGLTQFLQIISPTMNSMLMGGLYDHVGGGFFRYTNDERWMVPLFEKSLCDNALLVGFMTQMWQFNRNELCRVRITETIDWLLRETRLEGAFAGGQMAYSEGEEGKYYVWTEAEIDAALQGTFSARFKQVYGVRREGNFNGKTILRRFSDTAPPSKADEALMAKQRAMLLKVRDKRTPPLRDDKLLADWNGLAIRALAFAGSAFGRADWMPPPSPPSMRSSNCSMIRAFLAMPGATPSAARSASPMIMSIWPKRPCNFMNPPATSALSKRPRHGWGHSTPNSGTRRWAVIFSPPRTRNRC